MRALLLLICVSAFSVACSSTPSSELTDAAVQDAQTSNADAAVLPADVSVADVSVVDVQRASDVAVSSDGAAGSCTGLRADISGIRRTEGVIVARNGTVYFSQSGGIGRVIVGQAAEPNWIRIAGAGTVWGLALSADNATLYAGSPSTETVYTIDTRAATPSAQVYVNEAGQPNGLTMSATGVLFYSDFGGGHVYRVSTAAGTARAVRVTTSVISGANGVAFTADGHLLVASYTAGTIISLTLSDGTESARETIAMSLGSPDGVALDSLGGLWVTNNAGGVLIHLPTGGTRMNVLMSIGAAASVEFGPQGCPDIYVASSGDLRRYEMGTIPGATVPWH